MPQMLDPLMFMPTAQQTQQQMNWKPPSSYMNPAPQQKAGMLGIDPMTWLRIAGSFANGAQGGGWGGALTGTADALQGRQDRIQQESATDAQRRALMAMQAGDMPGAMRILSQAKGLEGLALQSQMAQAQRQEDRDYTRGENDRVYDRSRGDQLTDLNTQHGWGVEDREDQQRHDLMKPRGAGTQYETWRPATPEDVARYSLPNAGYLISNRGDVKPNSDSRKIGQVPASVQAQDNKFLTELDQEAANARSLAASMNNWNEQAKGFGAQGEGIFNDLGQMMSMRTSKLKAATDEMTPKMREAGSGTMSDRDVEMYRNAVPNINNTPEGNKMTAERRAAGAKRIDDHALFMRQYIADNPGKMNEAKVLWSKYTRAFPVYGQNGEINPGAPDPYAWATTQQAGGGLPDDDVSDLLEKYK